MRHDHQVHAGRFIGTWPRTTRISAVYLRPESGSESAVVPIANKPRLTPCSSPCIYGRPADSYVVGIGGGARSYRQCHVIGPSCPSDVVLPQLPESASATPRATAVRLSLIRINTDGNQLLWSQRRVC